MLTNIDQHRHGAQGTYDEASNGVKESDFGTKNDDAVIEKILLSGDLQESKVSQFLPVQTLQHLDTFVH